MSDSTSARVRKRVRLRQNAARTPIVSRLLGRRHKARAKTGGGGCSDARWFVEEAGTFTTRYAGTTTRYARRPAARAQMVTASVGALTSCALWSHYCLSTRDIMTIFLAFRLISFINYCLHRTRASKQLGAAKTWFFVFFFSCARARAHTFVLRMYGCSTVAST